jgi:hypothetical protein
MPKERAKRKGGIGKNQDFLQFALSNALNIDLCNLLFFKSSVYRIDNLSLYHRDIQMPWHWFYIGNRAIQGNDKGIL